MAMPSPSLLCVPEPLPLSMGQTYGAPQIGTWIMAMLYGMLCTQVYGYFSEYPKDSRALKTMVGSLWTLATLHMIFTCHAQYYFVISSAFDLVAMLVNIWSIPASILLHLVITFMVLCYWTVMAFRLSSPRWRFPVSLLMAVPTIALAVVGIFDFLTVLHAQTLLDYRNFVRTWSLVAMILQVVTDLLLSAVLCVVLNKHKTIFKRTNTLIKTIMLFTISRGILTAAVALVESFGLALGPGSFWWASVEYMIAELYANSLMVTLNARKSVREAATRTQTSFVIPLSRLMLSSPTAPTDSINSPVHESAPADANDKDATTERSGEDAPSVINIHFRGKHDIETASA